MVMKRKTWDRIRKKSPTKQIQDDGSNETVQTEWERLDLEGNLDDIFANCSLRIRLWVLRKGLHNPTIL